MEEPLPEDIDLLKLMDSRPDGLIRFNDPDIPYGHMEFQFRVENLERFHFARFTCVPDYPSSDPVAAIILGPGRRYLTMLQERQKDQSNIAAQHAACKEKQRLEQAKSDKQSVKRSWIQLIIGCILSALLTLAVEHFNDITDFLSSLF